MDVEAIPILRGEYDVRPVADFGITGDAPKNYIIFRAGRESETLAYIAKKARVEGPRECVTEYALSRIGARLPLRVAEGRLARLPTLEPGAEPDVRFLSRQFLNRGRGEQLVHGSQLVARCFEMREEELAEITEGEEWRFYTVDLVDEVLREGRPAADADRLRAAFARMLAHDALVGANDRHPQNWGVIESAVDKTQPPQFAPIFDTARGLFWNFSDEQLREKDQSAATRRAFVESYARRSVSLIGCHKPKQPNHFELIEHMLGQGNKYRAAIVQVVRAFWPDDVARMLHQEFRRLMSRRRLTFIDELLRHRHASLRRVCGLP